VRRFLATFSLLAVGTLSAGVADKTEDTPAAAGTRKVLEGKITVEFKDIRLDDALDEIKGLCKVAKLGNFGYRFGTGVSRNLTVTFQGKDKTVAEVLDGMFKKNGLGYIVISKEKDAYDGSVLVRQGKERGYPAGEEPTTTAKPEPAKEKAKPAPKEKPAVDGDKAEQMAQNKLNLIKDLQKNGARKERLKQQLQDLLRDYPKTKAAGEAREMLDKLTK
jgi:hypothetical protein